MYHFNEPVTNQSGDALVGYYVKAVDVNTDSVVDIYADQNGTAIETVSGQANAAEVDGDGMADFWLPGGMYHLDHYATDATTFVKRKRYVQMVDFATLSTTGIGYAVGAGATVTQLTSKSTGVTLNALCGQITMNAASLASGATVGFTVNNSLVTTSHVVVVNVASSSGYHAWVGRVQAGNFDIQLQNNAGGPLAEAVPINFALIQIATA